MKKCQVIALVQEKGGSGKSTLLATLSSLMYEDGAKVAVIDSDPLPAASDFVRACNKQSMDIDQIACTDERKLPKLIAGCRKQYDVVFVDTAGVGSKATDHTVQLSDLVLVPVKAARPDAKGFLNTLQTIKAQAELKSVHLGLDDFNIPTFIVLSDIDARTRVTADVEAQIKLKAKEKGIPVLSAKMLHRTGFKEHISVGGTLKGSARSVGREVLAAFQNANALFFYQH
jgi:chromosome partitioning protein